MSDLHNTILQIFFWTYVDTGHLSEETPLFIGQYDGEPIEAVIAEHFRIPPQEAKAAIETARKEVAL